MKIKFVRSGEEFGEAWRDGDESVVFIRRLENLIETTSAELAETVHRLGRLRVVKITHDMYKIHLPTEFFRQAIEQMVVARLREATPDLEIET